jgi:hypothetical protein
VSAKVWLLAENRNMRAGFFALSGWALVAMVALGTSYVLGSPLPVDAAAAGDKPIIEINVIDFDPTTGDVHARLHLRLPPSLVSKQGAPTHSLVFVDTTTVDESIVKLSSKEPFSSCSLSWVL